MNISEVCGKRFSIPLLNSSRDKSLADSDLLPAPDILASEIADALEAALDQFTKIAMKLTNKNA